MNRRRLARWMCVLVALAAASLLLLSPIVGTDGLGAFVKSCRIMAKGGHLLVRHDPETWRSAWFEGPQSRAFIGFLHGATIDESTLHLLTEYRFTRLSLAESTFSPEAMRSLAESQAGSLVLDGTNADDAAISYLRQSTTLHDLSLGRTAVTDARKSIPTL